MADNRHSYFPVTSLVDEIDSSLVKIHDAFRKAFCEGKEKPERKEESYKVTLFDEIWALLSHKDLKFLNLKELTGYYESASAQLENFIDDFCVHKNDIPKDSISENKRKMLAQILEVYHVLERQKHILTKFQPGDEPDIFNVHISGITQACGQADGILKLINPYEIKKMISTLDEIFFNITTTLNAQNYLNKSFPFRIPEGGFSDHLFVSPVMDALHRLPTGMQLLDITQKFENARRDGNHAQVEAYKLDIKLHQIAVHDVIARLDDALQTIYQAYNKAISELKEANKSVSIKLANVGQYSRLLDIYQLLQELDGYDEREDVMKKGYKQLLVDAAVNAQNSCNMQSPAEKMSFGFYPKGWKLAGIEVATLLPMLGNKIEVFMADYTDLIGVLQTIKRVKDQKTVLENLSVILQRKLDRGDETWKECRGAMVKMKDTILESYVQVNDEDTKTFVKSFLLEHWWKMGVGAAGGGGGSTALAICVFAVNPAFVALLAAAGVLGGAALSGGAAMLVKEKFGGKGRHENVDGESQLLLSGASRTGYATFNQPHDNELLVVEHTPVEKSQQTSWWQNMKFWSRSDASTAQSQPVSVVQADRPVLSLSHKYK